MDNKKIGLTIFLVKPEQVAAFDAGLLHVRDGALVLAPPFDGVFLPLPSAVREPYWLSAVRSVIQAEASITLNGQSPAGLLVIRREGRTFVVTFGHAWQLLEDQWLEQDFGRRVALNSIARNQVLEIRAEQVFAKWHIASERAPRASSVDEFGVEFDRDLVAAVEGVPSEPLQSLSVRLFAVQQVFESMFHFRISLRSSINRLFSSKATLTRKRGLSSITLARFGIKL